MNIADYIFKEEGWKNIVYRDSRGYLTVGVGHKIRSDDNLEFGDRIPNERVSKLFLDDLREAKQGAKEIKEKLLGEQDDDIVNILTCMVFQMGKAGVVGFRHMLHFIGLRDYRMAAAEMLDSKWHKEDSPARATRLAKIMEGIET